MDDPSNVPGTNQACPWDKPTLSLFYPGTNPVCPRDKPSLFLGQSWGQRVADKSLRVQSLCAFFACYFRFVNLVSEDCNYNYMYEALAELILHNCNSPCGKPSDTIAPQTSKRTYRSSKWHYRQRKIIFALFKRFIADTDTDADEMFFGINFRSRCRQSWSLHFEGGRTADKN